MVNRISVLTQAQIDAQPAFVDKWRSIGLSTEPADREMAEQAYHRCYQYAGLEPVPVEWVTSLWAAKQRLGDKLCYCLRGGLWMYWIARERYFTEVCDLDLGEMTERGAAYADTIRYGHIWWPFDNLIVACERPRAIRTDAEGRSHCETRPAIEYHDGTGLWCWHGQLLPAEWLATPGALTPEIALTYHNVELRRCAAEILGWDRILAELSPTVLDEDSPDIGTLLEVDLPDVGSSRFLRVRCGTGRTFALAVPEDTPTAVAAQIWIHGGNWQAPEVRT